MSPAVHILRVETRRGAATPESAVCATSITTAVGVALRARLAKTSRPKGKAKERDGGAIGACYMLQQHGPSRAFKCFLKVPELPATHRMTKSMSSRPSIAGAAQTFRFISRAEFLHDE